MINIIVFAINIIIALFLLIDMYKWQKNKPVPEEIKRIHDTNRKFQWLEQFDKEGLLDKMIDRFLEEEEDITYIEAFDKAVDKAYDILYQKYNTNN